MSAFYALFAAVNFGFWIEDPHDNLAPLSIGAAVLCTLLFIRELGERR